MSQFIGEVALAAQLSGLDSIKLIALIVNSANNARMHKKNCKQFAQHLNLIGNLLQQLKLSELLEWPETREPIERLEEALRKAFLLVNSCKDRSYLYLLALGWNIVSQFKECQAEIDRLLGLIPLITLVDNSRDRLMEAIGNDTRLYTLDEEELQIHQTILKTEVTSKEAHILERSLVQSYPGLSLNEVIKEENDKLRVELQEGLGMDHVGVIYHLLNTIESVFLPNNGLELSTPLNKYLNENVEAKNGDNFDPFESFCIFDHLGISGHYNDQTMSFDHVYEEKLATSSPSRQEFEEGLSPSKGDMLRMMATMKSNNEKELATNSSCRSTWHNAILDCCMDPYLCISTCMYPCGTFSDIVAFASDGTTSSEDTCNDCMTYSLLLSCFCYTSYYRRKLREQYNIEGGCLMDLCMHVFCFYCALVQEWNEILHRDGEDVNMIPPKLQKMEREG